MIEDLVRWTGHTALGNAMRDSTWAFAIVETVHLLALSVLGGALLATNLSAGRILFRRTDAATVARAAFPILLIALLVMIGSGALLAISKPLRYYLDDTFRAKIALLALATGSSLLLRRLLVRADASRPLLGTTAAASLLLWLGVGVCGRLIGFL